MPDLIHKAIQILGSDGEIITVPIPVTLSGGVAATVFRNISLGTTGQVVKASAGQLLGYFLYNDGLSVVYIKLYNKATVPTIADTPILTLSIPAQSAANLFGSGIQFASGISWRASTGVADNDNTAPSSNQVVANVFFI